MTLKKLRTSIQNFSHVMAASSPTHMFPGLLTPVLHTTYNVLSKQLATFPQRLLAHWWKTSDACHSDFCQTSERMLAELGFKLTTPVLTAHVTTDWATGAHDEQFPFFCHNVFNSIQCIYTLICKEFSYICLYVFKGICCWLK